MKKIVIAVLAVFMVLSLVACKKEPTVDEVYETYAEYVKAESVNESVHNVFSTMISMFPKADSVDISLYPSYISNDKIKRLWTAIEPLEVYCQYDNINVTEVNGNITVENYVEKNSWDVTLDNVVFKFTYDVKEFTTQTTTTTTVLENQEGTITISGTYSFRQEENIQTSSYNLTANENTYNTSSVLNSKIRRLTSGKVNGKDVDVRFCNVIVQIV